MAEGDDPIGVAEDQAQEIQHLTKRLDLFDERLDNIDSMVTAVAERVMSRLVTITITCPHCGEDVEIAMIGNEKPTR